MGTKCGAAAVKGATADRKMQVHRVCVRQGSDMPEQIHTSAATGAAPHLGAEHAAAAHNGVGARLNHLHSVGQL